MAEIDKPLPNTNQTQVPNEEIIEVEKTKSAEVIDTPTGPVEVAMDEEGGAEVSFDPNAAIDPIQDHFANLAESLGDEVLEPLGAKMVEQYNEYKESRGDWEDTYRHAGQFFWEKVSSLRHNKTLSPDNSGALVISPWEAIDIDTVEDWEYAVVKYRVPQEMEYDT